MHTGIHAHRHTLHASYPHTAYRIHAYCMPIVDTKTRLSFVHKTAERLSLCWINKPVST
jgi:hypothetical protein